MKKIPIGKPRGPLSVLEGSLVETTLAVGTRNGKKIDIAGPTWFLSPVEFHTI